MIKDPLLKSFLALSTCSRVELNYSLVDFIEFVQDQTFGGVFWSFIFWPRCI